MMNDIYGIDGKYISALQASTMYLTNTQASAWAGIFCPFRALFNIGLAAMLK